MYIKSNLPRGVIKFLLSSLKPFLAKISLQVVFQTCAYICFSTMIPLYRAEILVAVSKKNILGMALATKPLLLFWALGEIFEAISRVVQSYIYPYIEYSTRMRCFNFIQGIPLNIFYSYTPSYLENNATYIADGAPIFLQELFESVLPKIIAILYNMLMIFYTGWQFGVLTFGWGLIHGTLFWIMQTKFVLPQAVTHAKAGHTRTSTTMDLIRNQSLGKIYGLNNNFSTRLHHVAMREANLFHKYMNIETISSSLPVISLLLIQGLGFFFLCRRMFHLKVTSASNIQRLIIFNLAVIEGVWELSSQILSLSQTYGECQGSLHLFDEIKKKTEKEQNQSITQISLNKKIKKITVNNLTYGHQKRIILNNVNVSLNAGESILVMGPSGSGKTTFMNLLCGILKTPKQSVFINNHDISIYNSRSVLDKFTYVTQGTSILNTTIKDNIAIGGDKKNITDKEIQECANEVNITNLNRKTGTGGINLSGGECQRLAYARAKLHYNPGNVLLCDEITSGVDVTNAIHMVKEITKMARENNSILVFIEHSSVVAKYVDRIFFFCKKSQDQHCTLVDGTFDELYKSEKDFRKYFINPLDHKNDK